MLDLDRTYLEYEKPGIARVHCARCGAELGRVQVTPPTVKDDPYVWEEKVQGELDVLAAEHEPLCSNASHASMAEFQG